MGCNDAGRDLMIKLLTVWTNQIKVKLTKAFIDYRSFLCANIIHSLLKIRKIS